MQVIPAIDISGGKCVRREQGDRNRQIIYPHTPLDYAKKWEACGAERLHIVDLDAADGVGSNFSCIEKIVRATSAQVQVGGGVRTTDDVERYWKLGVSRIIMGTAAVENPETVFKAAGLIGNALAVMIDARDGIVLTHGWNKRSRISATELLLTLARDGIERVFYTDIARDGMLKGPNFHSISVVAKYAGNLTNPIKVGVGGGISMVEHLVQLKKRCNIDCAIIGRAIYEDKLNLAEAILEVARTE